MDRMRLFKPLAVGLLLLAVTLAVLGFHFFWHKTLVVPILFGMAALIKRFKLFVFDWAVFLGAVVLLDSLRGLAYSLVIWAHLPVYGNYAIAAERALLGGNTAPGLLQRWFYHGQITWLERVVTVAHASHFLVFLLFGMAIWVLRHERFRIYTRSMLLMMYTGLVVFFLVPTAPPWIASIKGRIPELQDITGQVYNVFVPALHGTFDTNPVAAMPSLHAAFPALCCILAFSIFGRAVGMAFAAYSALVAFTIMYTASHYLIDVLAGWTLAGAAYYVARRWHLRLHPRLEPLVCFALFMAAEIVGSVKVAMDAAAG